MLPYQVGADPLQDAPTSRLQTFSGIGKERPILKAGNEVKVTILPTAKAFDGVTENRAWWIFRGTEGLHVTIGGVRLPGE